MDSITAALEDLRLQDKPNIAATAKKYEVQRSTLSRRFNKVTQSKPDAVAQQRLLSEQQEQTLVQYINRLTDISIPPTVYIVRTFAGNIVGKLPGRGWSHRFCKRWSHVLDSRYLTTIDLSRTKADSKRSYTFYFDLLEHKIHQCNVQARDMYNMDEKGFLIGFLTKARRIFTKSAFESKRLLGAGQSGNREWITVIATICADGTWLSPAIIYRAETGNLQDTWVQDFEGSKHNAYLASSVTGWTNESLGMSWLTTIFHPATVTKARRSWRLLFVDGHGSYINMSFLDWCLEHRILVACYPPHSTHRLQPLDVSLFTPLGVYYGQELD